MHQELSLYFMFHTFRVDLLLACCNRSPKFIFQCSCKQRF